MIRSSTSPTRRHLLAAAPAVAAALALPTGPEAAASTHSFTETQPPIQPFASYWFPGSIPTGTPGPGVQWRSLRDWSPATDQDLAHNTASVPLAARFTPVPPNTTARAGQARISSLVSFAPTAGNPSQGSVSAHSYALTHWAYLDELVFWGGSAGEGIVLAPNAPIVDAAHRNGVRVLGNVFLPPVAYGGDLQWTRDLVETDALGRFPIAEKLAEVARRYGFDGWFVNAETDGGDGELASRMVGFLRALRAAGAAHGLRTTWYDAMNTTGRVGWQGALNSLNQDFFEDRRGTVSDSVFLDFRWTGRRLTESGSLAERLGRSRYALWAGIDVEAHGWNTDARWEEILPTDREQVVSFGFYRPEWTLHQLTGDNRTPGEFHRADDHLWTGESLDPARPSPSRWRAPATVVADRSTITAAPFACAFNTGHGLRWYQGGRVRSERPWSHLGLQDRLPGRRWVVETEGRRPSVNFDFEDAWRGGSSLLVSGVLDAPTTVGLHSTRLPIGPCTVMEIVHRAQGGPVTVEVGVALREPAAGGERVPYTWLPVSTLGAGDGWKSHVVRLAPLAGGTAHALGVRLSGTSAAPQQWRLGLVAVRDAADGPPAPAGLHVVRAARRGPEVDLRLAWERAAGQVRHYEVFRRTPSGEGEFLGGTCGDALYVPHLVRLGRERSVHLEVRAVSELYALSAAARTRYHW
ncbi:endo-beta-N-acetylglucosaminidase [Streptomyces sp. NPDC006879]|uniref:endo-beta-N-acetylglucosaminidase n=1 Tax=Streptomyces sp. NPDC006879 TaxID=3364767 RepID=UPI0036C64FC5